MRPPPFQDMVSSKLTTSPDVCHRGQVPEAFKHPGENDPQDGDTVKFEYLVKEALMTREGVGYRTAP